MNEPIGTLPPAPDPMLEPPKKNNTPLIIGAVVVVVLCCCCLFAVLAYTYGDQVMQALGLQ